MKLRTAALEAGTAEKDFWLMTVSEIVDLLNAKRTAYNNRLADLYKANEILAFNIGALVLTAVNLPGKFPKSPEAAFTQRNGKRDWRAEKSDFYEIAKQLNKRLNQTERDKYDG